MVDLTSIGAAHRAEAEKAKQRTFAFAVVLVLAHLLDVRPSEAEALGLKVTVKDPVVIYGAIALLFGYHFSRFVSDSNKGEAFLPLQIAPRHMRSCLRIARRMHSIDKTKRKVPQSPEQLKKSARWYIRADNIILLPYRLIAVFFVLAAFVFMVADLTGLAVLVWLQSPLVSEVTKFFSDLL